ncbi:DUF6695 family protein [Cochleicola gelatinilyticus]|uniref:Uncharacterized protein n=1 Tax=Cochleicola gelatinilyticus TaxID=1763537 RepID=A0A167F2T6_9FLAO|nr:DUF6695 family protein [Cochleicola gelatinilyticus]OAB76131.1 hypothetical protein ULVI_13830 [Cochleicola gelatinilyticus]
MKSTGKIIVLAFPDTFVTMSEEWICKVLPLVGLGTKEYIKAGHAALVLIENKTGAARYFDFGRYVTPKGFGRVRGANTDAELEIPFKANISETGSLKNTHDFLLWLDANPLKTHGEGRLLASVCDAIHFKNAEKYIGQLQERGSIPYGAFDKTGSNCSRFVTDTILAATNHKGIRKALLFNKLFTPSTVGNVEKAASQREVFEVKNGKIDLFQGSALKENLTNYFDVAKKTPAIKVVASKNSSETIKKSTLQKLTGTGSSAYFELLQEPLSTDHYRIRRYNELMEIDFDGVYFSEEFEASEAYVFTYDSHCEFCHVFQNNKKIKLQKIASYAEFSSRQKEHSV